MGSNPPGKGMAHVSTSVPVAIVDEIDRRAQALDIKRGAYLRHLILRWYEQGAPAVNPSDEAILQVAENRAGYGRKPKG